MATVTKRRGRYVLDFYDNQGKRQRQTCKEGTTLKKAKEALRLIEDQVSRGVYVAGDKIPVFETLAESWLKHKKANLRESTWGCYEGHTKNHFAEFKGVKVNRITPAMIEKFIADRQAEKMPIATIRKNMVSLNQILKFAVRYNYIANNPASVADRPRDSQAAEHGADDKIRVLTPNEIKAFLNAEKDQKYRVMFTVAVMTGLRQGELIGLKWSDIDWKAKQIRVERTFNMQAWYQLKTKGSRRRIDLGPVTLRELKLWKLACPPNDLDLVFPNEAGGPINHNNLVARHFRPALTAAKIDLIRFHDLRHTFASMLIEQGENLKYIQAQLGHSSPTVTLNVYAHLMKPTNQEAATRLDNAIFGTGHQTVTTKKKGVAAVAVTP